MKKALFLLCAVLSLFAGSALAMGIIPDGDGISMAQPSVPPIAEGSPQMPMRATLFERICPVTIGYGLTYRPKSTDTGIVASGTPVAFDTGDPSLGTMDLNKTI